MSLDRKQPYIFTIDGVLSGEECRALIERIDGAGPEPAPINTRQGVRVRSDVRNNERVIFDDPQLAATIFERIRDRVPAEVHGMRLVGANERLRCYRYKAGMRFAPHADGAFHRDDWERSWYTCIVYLNEGFRGGETVFVVEPPVRIEPRTGTALLFQHPIIHEGAEVTRGVKYALRTDLMYRAPEAG